MQKEIRCPKCFAHLPAAAINIQTEKANCTACDLVFSIEDTIEALRTKKEIFKPESFKVKNDGSVLSIFIPQSQNMPKALNSVMKFGDMDGIFL